MDAIKRGSRGKYILDYQRSDNSDDSEISFTSKPGFLKGGKVEKE